MKQPKREILRILNASISEPKKRNQPYEPLTKPYIGRLEDDSFCISPRTSYSHHASLLIKGRLNETETETNIELRFRWTALDYLLNGTIIGCFTAMSYFCLRHSLHHGFIQTLNILPFFTLLFAYFIIMLMFDLSVRHREEEFIDLFINQYPD
ncbi:MAG: hypothetical protein AB1Z19_05770 [Eubacteriales bacterium]